MGGRWSHHRLSTEMSAMDKIICLGKNFAEHAKELNEALPERPVIFIKPPSVLKYIETKALVLLQEVDSEIHPECELVLELKSGGYRLSPERAAECIGGWTIGLDLTLRKIQSELKSNGHPWTISKVFPDSAIVGKRVGGIPPQIDFEFCVNGQLRQRGDSSQMLLNPIQGIVYISQYFSLNEGDLIFMGTPKGVGPVFPGDRSKIFSGKGVGYEIEWTR